MQTVPEQAVSKDDPAASPEGSRQLHRRRAVPWTWLPLILCLTAVVTWWFIPEWTIGTPRLTLPILNGIFSVLAWLVVALLAAHSVLAGGPPSVLLLGAGSLAFGLASAVSGLTMPTGRHDMAVAVYNIGVCMAGAASLLAGLWLILPAAGPQVRSPHKALWISYAGAVLAVGLVTSLAPTPWIPAFFVEGQGPTAVRQAVLAMGIAEFLLAGLLLRIRQRQNRSAFLHWYSLGLMLIAVGLLGVFHIEHIDSTEAWTGRVAQYVGGLYLLIAAAIAVRDSRRWMIPLEVLRETHERYIGLVEHSPDAILVHTGERYIFANPAACRLFGASSPQDLVGRRVLDLVHPDSRERVAQRMHTSMQKQATALAEVRVLRLDGQAVDVESLGVGVEYEGQPAVQVMLRDITARKQAAEALAERTSQLHAMFEHSSAGLVLFDARPPYRVLAVNRYYQELWPEPYRTQGLVGLALTEFAPGLEEAGIADVFREVVQTGKGRYIPNTPYDHMVGGRRWWNWTLEPVVRDGQVVALAHLAIDVTQEVKALQQAEQATHAVQRSEERYRSLFNSMTEGFAVHEIITDEVGQPVDWRFLDINPAFERSTGLKRRDVIGRTHNEVLPGDDPKWLQMYGRVALTGEPVQFENYSPALKRHYQVLAYRPAPRQFAVIFMDITERKQMEEAVRVSGERYRLLAETMLHGVVHQDARGTIIAMNPAAMRILGKTPEEFLGSSSVGEQHDTVREDGSPFPGLEHPAMVALRTGQPVHNVVMGVFNPREGRRRWIRIDAVPVRRPDERESGEVYTVFEDITDQKQAQEALRQAKEQYQLLFDVTRDGIVFHELSTEASRSRILQVNQAACNLLGYSREELLALSPMDIQTPEDRAAVAAEAERMSRDARLLFEKTLLRKDGSTFTAEIHSAIFTREDRQYVVSAIRDITERKRAEDALRKSEERLRLACDAAGFGTYDYDFATQTMTASPEFRALYGLAADQPLELDADRVPTALHPDDRGRFLAGMSAANQPPGPGLFDLEYRIIRGDGAVRWLRVYGQTLFGADAGSRRPVRAVGMIHDVTSRKQAEEQLKELNGTLEQRVAERTAEAQHRSEQLRALTAQLTQAEQKERQRLALVLHDHLQQLLAGAKFNLGVLRGQLENQEQQDSLNKVDDLLDESLDTSRSLTVDLCPPILQQGTMPQVLHWLADWVRRKHGLVVEVHADEKAHPPAAETRVLLFQVVRELLFNIVKHAQVKQACVELSRTDDKQIQVVVSDAGLGFDPSQPHDDKRKGSGFGLLAVRERIEWLGGRLDVRSCPGSGTRITVTLPMQPGASVVEPLAVSVVAPTDASPAARTGKVRILLADDHAVMRDGLCALLQRQPDVEVVGQASSGREAVQMAEQLRPDVVIMDVNMPEMDGKEATRQILARWPNVKVIGLSMFAEPDVAEAMKVAGAVDYLAKTSGPQALVSAIRAATDPVS